MGRVGSADVGILMAGGYDLQPQIFDMTLGAKEAILERADTFGDTWEESDDTHNRKSALSIRGFYDEGANSVDAALVALAQAVVMINIEGNVNGKRFSGYSGAVPTYARRPARGELTKIEATFQPTGIMEEGVILHAKAAYAADPLPNSGAIDNTTSSAAGGSGYLEVQALTLGGYTSLQYKVRHSTDNVVYVDLITFTNVTTAPQAQRVTVAGTVNRYVRAEGDFIGAGAGQSVTLASGFVRN